MTTFVDREQAIEAHYALLELAVFRDRLHRYKELGYSLAAGLDLHRIDAERLAIEVAQGCVSDPIDGNVCSRLATEMCHLGLDLSGT
ncbi:MAG TPA: ATPase inhibitor subunit zeta, partial [Candidatus Binataceae bacterium]|nr:ATPase inhibitor subunit zeta [Candidatus Binataceae bacterium]